MSSAATATSSEIEKNEKPPTVKPAVELPRAQFLWIMVVIWVGNFAAFFNETTATTSMHAIGQEFAALSDQNWIATSYLLGFTVTQTLLGKFCDIFGRQLLFNSTLLLFSIGTLWCALSPSMISVVIARLIQGIGAAGRQTIGLIIILDCTTPQTRGMWLGTFHLSLSLGLAVGPWIGAILSVMATWRYTFWITLILNALTFIIALIYMRFPGKDGKISEKLKQVDYVGSFLAVGTASLVCIALELGGKQFKWNSVPIIVMFCLAAVLIPAFAYYELHFASQPIVNFRLFKKLNIILACFLNFVCGAALFGSVFYLPRYFINVLGSDLITAGVQLFGLNIAAGFSSVAGSNLISLTGKTRLVGVMGAVPFILGAALMFTVNEVSPAWKSIVLSILMGLGIGCLYQPALVVGPMSVKQEEVAGISGFLGFLRTLGGTVATALLTSVFDTSFKSQLYGVLPSDLVDTGLKLADEHENYPEYNGVIIKAIVYAFHIGYIPVIAFGITYLVSVVLLRGVDFTPKPRKT
ncbi:uncharacterized protein VTP21DRAFT_2270 [Calcarisporiella thermophila]|uniref:uncharacterized protein n=1 Tax=Calcarisporiella thermophila TaxID=911321 RepID=UPI003742FE3C